MIERNNFNEGTTIAAVADMGDLIFQGKVDESEVGKVKLKMPVVLTVGAIENAKWNAELEYIAPKGVEENGAIQFEIRAAVKLKDGESLRSGYSANADIVLDQRDSVLTVPESIVSFNTKGDSAFVFVTNPGGEGEEAWKKTYIKTGLSDGINLEVLEGIDGSTELKGAKKEEATVESWRAMKNYLSLVNRGRQRSRFSIRMKTSMAGTVTILLSISSVMTKHLSLIR